jgi:hypothetical protein
MNVEALVADALVKARTVLTNEKHPQLAREVQVRRA